MDIASYVAPFLALFFAEPCTQIDTLPASISEPGQYCLSADLHVATAGDPGISVFSNDVTIDLQGHRISGPGTGFGAGIGGNGVTDVNIFNGTVSGFFYGARFESVDTVTLSDLTLEDNIFRGATVLGSNVTVEDTEVRGVTGYSEWPDSHSFGIGVTGPNCAVRRNKISGIVPFRAGEAVGVSVNNNASGCAIDDNLIWLDQPHDRGRYIGIWVGGVELPKSVARNVIANVDYSLAYSKLSGLAVDNWIQERCADGWNAEPEMIDAFASENHVARSGQCSDDLEYLRQMVADKPNAAHWHLRYATVLRYEFGNEAGLPSLERACALGAQEGCRIAGILRKLSVENP